MSYVALGLVWCAIVFFSLRKVERAYRRRKADRRQIMGWGYGVVNGREVGYSVQAVCEHEGCEEKIDRGLGFICGTMHGQDDGEGCGGYFCGKHLFYGGPNQMCESCLNAYEAEHPAEVLV